MRIISALLLSSLILFCTACGSSAGLTALEDFNAVLKKVGNTTTYQMLLSSAGGVTQLLGLKQKGTLIVPTDEAFNQLGGEALMKLMDARETSAQLALLKKHVLLEGLTPKKLQAMGNVTALEGNAIPVKLESNVLSFGEAKVISSFVTPEGVVYIVNKVL